MYESILVPTDGSDAAEQAARHAVALAEAFDATLHVLGVVDVDEAAGPFDAGGVDEEFVERLESESESAVQSIADIAGDRRVETRVVEGGPGDTILERAAAEGIDLVSMGTKGRTGLTRVLTGSTSARVVREAGVPVMTVHGDDEPSPTAYDDVLIPTDGSPAAEAAVDHGIAVADAFDATVHAVNVVDVASLAGGADATGVGAGGAGGAGTATGDLLDPLVEQGEEATERIAERARAEGLNAVAEVVQGSPDSVLLDYVDDEPIDLVSMGTHGRTGLDRFMLGSTTERMMRHAPVPVLSVRGDENDSE